ncbi:hypothetical protein [Vreelandella sp. EE27]
MRKVDLRPLSDTRPGYGQLVLIGGDVPEEGVSVDIQRNQDDHYLQADGQWGSHSFKFTLPALQIDEDGNPTAVVDEQIVDPLLENPHATNMARFYSADGTELGRARIKLARNLLASRASGSTPALNAGAALQTAETPPPDSEPEAPPVEQAPIDPPVVDAPPPAPEPLPKPAKSSKRWLWIALALVLLAALAAALWFGLSMRDGNIEAAGEEEPAASEPVDEPPESPEPVPVEVEAAPCSLQRMSEQAELEFIQGCTSTEIDPDAMMEVIDNALANEHCAIARRLYAHGALSGEIQAALGYARQFDPKQHTASACFPEADTETAIFWYETAQNIDADNAEANQRLEALSQ